MPRVSVLIAAYDARDTIEATLASLVGQTFADWEAIVADDCSTDGTADVAGSVDDRIRVIRSPRNLGHAAPTRNLAAEHATGELLAFLDDDDRWLPGYLERLVGTYDAAVASGRDVAVVSCDALLERDGVAQARTYLDVAGRRGAWLGVDDLLRTNPIYASALVRRDVFEELGGLEPELRGTDDYDLWLRVAETGRAIAVVDEPLAVYRLSDDQISADERAMAASAAAVFRRALARGRLSPRQRAMACRSLVAASVTARFPVLGRLAARGRTLR